MIYEIIDHNIVGEDYVSYIVELANGKKSDPATSAVIFIGTWRAGDLETEERGAFDPDFGAVEPRRHDVEHISPYDLKPRPLVWAKLDVTQEPDQSVLQHRRADERMSHHEQLPFSWRQGSDGVTYEDFFAAVDRVALDEQDDEAWATIDKWRGRQLQEEGKAPS